MAEFGAIDWTDFAEREVYDTPETIDEICTAFDTGEGAEYIDRISCDVCGNGGIIVVGYPAFLEREMVCPECNGMGRAIG